MNKQKIPAKKQPLPAKRTTQRQIKPEAPKRHLPQPLAAARKVKRAANRIVEAAPQVVTAGPSNKKAAVVALLGRPHGADVAELTAATGWLPHTVRAFLSGLRKDGMSIERDKNTSGATIYRIEAAA